MDVPGYNSAPQIVSFYKFTRLTIHQQSSDEAMIPTNYSANEMPNRRSSVKGISGYIILVSTVVEKDM